MLGWGMEYHLTIRLEEEVIRTKVWEVALYFQEAITLVVNSDKVMTDI
jgi:hypothetical protein